MWLAAAAKRLPHAPPADAPPLPLHPPIGAPPQDVWRTAAPSAGVLLSSGITAWHAAASATALVAHLAAAGVGSGGGYRRWALSLARQPTGMLSVGELVWMSAAEKFTSTRLTKSDLYVDTMAAGSDAPTTLILTLRSYDSRAPAGALLHVVAEGVAPSPGRVVTVDGRQLRVTLDAPVAEAVVAAHAGHRRVTVTQGGSSSGAIEAAEREASMAAVRAALRGALMPDARAVAAEAAGALGADAPLARWLRTVASHGSALARMVEFVAPGRAPPPPAASGGAAGAVAAAAALVSTLSSRQRAAVGAAATAPASNVVGYAGTGKTTVAVAAAAALAAGGARVAVVSPFEAGARVAADLALAACVPDLALLATPTFFTDWHEDSYSDAAMSVIITPAARAPEREAARRASRWAVAGAAPAIVMASTDALGSEERDGGDPEEPPEPAAWVAAAGLAGVTVLVLDDAHRMRACSVLTTLAALPAAARLVVVGEAVTRARSACALLGDAAHVPHTMLTAAYRLPPELTTAVTRSCHGNLRAVWGGGSGAVRARATLAAGLAARAAALPPPVAAVLSRVAGDGEPMLWLRSSMNDTASAARMVGSLAGEALVAAAEGAAATGNPVPRVVVVVMQGVLGTEVERVAAGVVARAGGLEAGAAAAMVRRAGLVRHTLNMVGAEADFVFPILWSSGPTSSWWMTQLLTRARAANILIEDASARWSSSPRPIHRDLFNLCASRFTVANLHASLRSLPTPATATELATATAALELPSSTHWRTVGRAEGGAGVSEAPAAGAGDGGGSSSSGYGGARVVTVAPGGAASLEHFARGSLAAGPATMATLGNLWGQYRRRYGLADLEVPISIALRRVAGVEVVNNFGKHGCSVAHLADTPPAVLAAASDAIARGMSLPTALAATAGTASPAAAPAATAYVPAPAPAPAAALPVPAFAPAYAGASGAPGAGYRGELTLPAYLRHCLTNATALALTTIGCGWRRVCNDNRMDPGVNLLSQVRAVPGVHTWVNPARPDEWIASFSPAPAGMLNVASSAPGTASGGGGGAAAGGSGGGMIGSGGGIVGGGGSMTYASEDAAFHSFVYDLLARGSVDLAPLGDQYRTWRLRKGVPAPTTAVSLSGRLRAMRGVVVTVDARAKGGARAHLTTGGAPPPAAS